MPVKIWLRLLFVQYSSLTSCMLTVGAVAGVLSSVSKFGDPWALFMMAAFLPVAPFVMYFSSLKHLRHNLETWKAWQKKGLITEPQYRELRETALRWYRERWFPVNSSSNSADQPPGPSPKPGKPKKKP